MKWGSDGAAAKEFHIPQQMAEAPDGTLYIADAGNNRIQVYKPRKPMMFEKTEPLAAPNRPRAPGPSFTPLTSATPESTPTRRPRVTPTPEPSGTPAATGTPTPTPSPKPTQPATPTPLPTRF